MYLLMFLDLKYTCKNMFFKTKVGSHNNSRKLFKVNYFFVIPSRAMLFNPTLKCITT